MTIRQLKPDDPEVLEAVLQRIRTMTREEHLERLRRRPDFDEAWVGAPAEAAPEREGEQEEQRLVPLARP